MKKPTLLRFLGKITVVYFILMLLGMCLIFTYTVHRAQNDSISWTVRKDARHATRHVIKDSDGSLSIEQNLVDDLDDYYLAIVNDTGKIVSGQLPVDLEDVTDDAPSPKKDERFRVYKQDGETYYIFDAKIHRLHLKENGDLDKDRNTVPAPDGYYVRSIICASDVDTIYSYIEKLFYGFVVILIFVAVFIGFFLYRKAASPVSQMCDDLETLTNDPDYSKRIENTSLFYETEVITNAYNKLMDRNEQLIHQQEEFNENVSHELRTPVAVIRSETELLQELYSDDLPAEAEHALTVMHDQSDRINAMITELMYMAQMDRENFAPKKEPMELSVLAESACEDMDDMDPGRNSFVYHWEPSEAEIDVPLVMIAVRNLLSNAVKYSPRGSVIELFSGTDDQGMAYLRIVDQGMGISKEDLGRIFEPYYQVKSERNSDGFGLGLALVMKIAVKHGGTVLVDSEPGKGSAFTLLLPIK